MMSFLIFSLFIFGAIAKDISWETVYGNGTVLMNKFNLDDMDNNVSTSRSGDNCDCGNSLYGLTSCSDSRRGLDMNRVIGGRLSNFNEIPWQIRLVVCRADGSCYTCGGSLINHRYVLTAAHCLKEKGGFALIDKMSVELGIRDVRYTSAFSKKVGVESFEIHGEYEARIAKNDIALVKLKEHIDFNRGIKPICLPTSDASKYVDLWAVASGWGQTRQGVRGGSNILKRTRLQVLRNTNQYCINGASLGRAPWAKQLCAYAEGTDTCGGDSGGPLALPEHEKCTLIGIVSYGLDCALAYHAGVYTRVSEYLFWIKYLAKSGGCLDSNPTPKVKYCNMRCRWGHVTTNYIIQNKYRVKCNDGICYAEDPAVDLCKIYNTPCGPIVQ